MAGVYRRRIRVDARDDFARAALDARLASGAQPSGVD
jgi:hypothetical protein